MNRVLSFFRCLDESRFQKRNVLVLDEELDDSGCPKYKLVLLCGPPGLGKTTLAHVVARHAGDSFAKD